MPCGPRSVRCAHPCADARRRPPNRRESHLVTLSTTDDLTGVCGHKLHAVDFFNGHFDAATTAGTTPTEPLPGNADAGCTHQDACTTDTCVAGACVHQAIPSCP